MYSKDKLNEIRVEVELEQGKDPFVVFVKALSLNDISNLINAEAIYYNQLSQGNLSVLDPYLNYAQSAFLRWEGLPVFMDGEEVVKVDNLKELFELRIPDNTVMLIGAKLKEAVIDYAKGRGAFEKK